MFPFCLFEILRSTRIYRILQIGAGAITLSGELIEGESRASSTFDSPELVEGGSFEIDDMEIYEAIEFDVRQSGKAENECAVTESNSELLGLKGLSAQELMAAAANHSPV